MRNCMCPKLTGRDVARTFTGHRAAPASAIASWSNPEQRQRKPAFT